MKNYGTIIFLFFLFVIPIFANEPLISKKKAPLSIALPLLESIDQHAIILGTGPIHMYAFIDPVCPRSREFVSMIVESDKMRKRYTYHFFYYELKRFNTKGLIANIYTQEEPLVMMKRVMIDKEEIPSLKSFSLKVQREIDEISAVAEKLDIYKRPYLFVVKPEKGAK